MRDANAVQGKCETKCPFEDKNHAPGTFERALATSSKLGSSPDSSFVCAWQTDDQCQDRGLLARVPASMPTSAYSCGHSACMLRGLGGCGPGAPGHLDGSVEMRAGEGATTASRNAFCEVPLPRATCCSTTTVTQQEERQQLIICIPHYFRVARDGKLDPQCDEKCECCPGQV